MNGLSVGSPGLLQATELFGAQSSVLFLPPIGRLLAYADLPAHLLDRLADFSLLERKGNLFVVSFCIYGIQEHFAQGFS